MQYLVYALLFVIFQAAIAVSHSDKETKQFLRNCPSLSQCGKFDIRFPLSLDSSPSYCSPSGMQLSCNNNSLFLLSLSNIGPVEVTDITYYDITPISQGFASMRIKLGESWFSCPLQKLISVDLTNSPYAIDGTGLTLGGEGVAFAFLNCSTRITWTNETAIAGPFLCLSDEHHFVYVIPAAELIIRVPFGCDVSPTAREIPNIPDYFYYFDEDNDDDYRASWWEQQVNNFTQMPEMVLRWRFVEMSSTCNECAELGKLCVYSETRNKVYCKYQGPRLDLIAGITTSGLLSFTMVTIILLKIIKYYREEEALKKVEKFLENYWSTAPTRYTYAEVIKIAKRFKHKLGQGGFGSLYKGELPNGIPVAVKVLEKFIGEDDEFINEVSTIGTIHHFNIVRLLGFSAEGSKCALIYEFMPNESLAKHIFCKEVNGHKPLSMEMLQDIAIGIARGIEYLHQGCNQRILHSDIKPHNILLDYNFKPKIADFGLAKLCSKEQSIVTMTAVRGTTGYIAPELYSRNFGTVSYKSDVYSFGMLLLEMTGKRKNLDPDVENQSQIYFPEWVYDQLVHNDQAFKIVFKMNDKEEAIMKKLVIVALWCIQWSPTDRPSMTKVLQMLIDSSDNLQIPPKPFISSNFT